jgi:1-aminocyclopropane-1-carboxylate deaminase/D-cysteine desulfhydrase-like pyridoxal-dependent ACC family enzyme
LSRRMGGVRVLVKRDDLTGLGFGGNKIRGLEFTIGEALEKRADTLITWGIAKSLDNHCRLTAAVAARAGMECVILLGGSGFNPSLTNAFVSQLAGAEFRFAPTGEREELIALCEELMDELRAEGCQPYLVHESCFRGGQAALGYVDCALELRHQLRPTGVKVDYIYTCSEGGTQAGLVLGKKLLGEELGVVGIAPARRDPGRAGDIAQWAREGARLLGLELDISETDIVNRADFANTGGRALNSACLEAIEMIASAEGLILDPVYTGKAMAGLIEDVRSGAIKPRETVVFVHTGGTPIIFDYVNEVGRLSAAN